MPCDQMESGQDVITWITPNGFYEIIWTLLHPAEEAAGWDNPFPWQENCPVVLSTYVVIFNRLNGTLYSVMTAIEKLLPAQHRVKQNWIKKVLGTFCELHANVDTTLDKMHIHLGI